MDEGHTAASASGSAKRQSQLKQRERIRAGMVESMNVLDGSLTATVAALTGLSPERIAKLGGTGDWDR